MALSAQAAPARAALRPHAAPVTPARHSGAPADAPTQRAGTPRQRQPSPPRGARIGRHDRSTWTGWRPPPGCSAALAYAPIGL